MPHHPNHEADIQNPNKGTDGTNITWDQAQGNRGKQLNPNQRPDPQPPAAPPGREAGPQRRRR